MRTYNRVDWEAALAQWDAGKFSDEWKPYRHQAAMRGMIYPPEGTRYDQWDDDEPSQRAMLVRAIRETPTLLGVCIDRSRSWGEVVARLIRVRDDWREEQRRRVAVRPDPDPREATVSIRHILERIWNS